MGKKKQQGNGSGSVYPRKNKAGKITSHLGAYYGLDGKRRTVSAKTKTECQRLLRQAMGEADQGIVAEAGGLTVEAFLTRWLLDTVKPYKAHRTYSTHSQQIRSHILPAIGRAKLKDLRKAHVYKLYAGLLHGSEGKSPLAPSSVRRVHAVLHAALEEAVRGDLIPRNPATHANKPTAHPEEVDPLDTKQVLAFLEAAKGSRYEALYVLCLVCGLRQGEALGLRWQDVDLEAGTLRVNYQIQRVRRDGGTPGKLEPSDPKNASRRTVGLPQRAVEALRNHRASARLRHGLQAGSRWLESGLVFTSIKGTPLEARNVIMRSFKPLLESVGLPKATRFHDMRHTCLSLLAAQGTPIRDLQALAGHTTAAFTLQRYAHHYDSSVQRTANAMDTALE